VTHKHIFQKGINAQDLPQLIAQDEAVNMENLRYGSTDSAGSGVLQNIMATLMRSGEDGMTFPEAGHNYCIGARGDDSLQVVIYFVKNSVGNHGIYLYSDVTKKNYIVERGIWLNFSGLIHSIAIIAGKLYFTDDVNEPRCLNLASCMQRYNPSAPLVAEWTFGAAPDPYEYNLVRRPLNLPPIAVKDKEDSVPVNLIANESFSFATQLVYFDGETSVLSPYSTASKLNTTTDTYNYINLTISRGDTIPESARKVRLVVRIGSTGLHYVIKQWDRKVSPENNAINSHNNGTTPLSFKFFNTTYEEEIDQTTSGLSFHYIPRLCSTLEVIKNRLFIGNLLDGYNSPSETSLAAVTGAPVSGNITTISGLNLVKVRLLSLGNGQYWWYTAWWVKIDTLDPNKKGYYELVGTAQIVSGATGASPLLDAATHEPTLVAAPTTVAVTGLRWLKSGNWFDAMWVAKEPIASVPGYSNTIEEVTDHPELPVTVTGVSTVTLNIFKSLSPYQMGVVFYDRAMRRCGVVTNDHLVINIPPRDFNFTSGVGAVNWTLLNTNTLAEIPEWAYYYSVVMTKNLRTRFFLQSYDQSAKYATKSADGKWEYTTATTFGPTVVAIALDTTGLLQANLGYQFTEGDMCILIDESSNTYSLPILAQDGKYILLSPKDVGTIASKKFVYEIYTPYKNSSMEPFYEMGLVFKVTNPGTGTRAYSQTFGSVNPDSYCLTRNYSSATYFGEAMSPIDKFWKRWDTDHGRINLKEDIGERRLRTAVRFSSTYVEGTAVNGLSEFLPANEEILPSNLGPLRKLVSAAKVQREGGVLLAISEKETISIYVGEAQLSDASGSQILVRSTGVIGSINPLQGSMGTRNPESVAVLDGRVFWVDTTRGVVASYSNNGLFPISSYKMERVLHLMMRSVEATGSPVSFFGGVDPYHNEYLVSVPKTEATPPKGTLTDPNIDFPYDIWDGKAKTYVYKILQDRWQGSQGFTAEYFASMGAKLFSFSPILPELVIKRCYPNEHGAGPGYNSFYGVPVSSSLMLVENGQPDATIKEYNNISVVANLCPDYCHVRTEEPYVQSTDILGAEFDKNESIYYGVIKGDRLTPGPGTGDEKMERGDSMRGPFAFIWLRWDTTSQLQLREVNVSFDQSMGHSV
jgi:hypothetical protein